MRWRLGLLGSVLAVVLLACGGGGGTSGSQPPLPDPPPGTLDTTFGSEGTGIVIKDAEEMGYHDYIEAIAIDAHDRIVAVGSRRTVGVVSDFLVMRFTPDGMPDASFGIGGSTTADLGGNEEARAVAIQADGRIVVAGRSFTDGPFHVVRFLSDGSPDGSFGTGGKVAIAMEEGGGAQAVAIQDDGKIVVGGKARSMGDTVPQFGLARLTSTGTLDLSFDGDGYTLTTVGSSASALASLAIEPGGKIVAGGYAREGALPSQFAVVRHNADGTLDGTFDGDGKVTTSVGADSSYGQALALDGTRIVVGGQAHDGTNLCFGVARYTDSGALDSTFNGSGTVLTSGWTKGITALAVTPTHKIVAVADGSGGLEDFSLARYNEDGSLDTSLQGTGRWTLDVTGDIDSCTAVALQGPKGKIVLAGHGWSGTSRDAILVRVWP